MVHSIGHTRNGIPVIVNLVFSQAAAHIARRPYLLELVKEALHKTTVRTPEASIEHDMGRSVGYNFVVETTATDNVLYACLVRENTYTRFIKNGKPLPTKYLTIILRRDRNNNYELCDTWIGRLSPPLPGSANETAESKSYWANHAVVLDNQPLQTRTVTKICPY